MVCVFQVELVQAKWIQHKQRVKFSKHCEYYNVILERGVCTDRHPVRKSQDFIDLQLMLSWLIHLVKVLIKIYFYMKCKDIRFIQSPAKETLHLFESL